MSGFLGEYVCSNNFRTLPKNDTRGSFIMTQILYFNPNEERMIRRLKKACPKTAGHALKRLICLRQGCDHNDGKHEGTLCGI
jgi:hypothetical protein